MASSEQYVATVWHRITKGKPQPQAGLWRSSVQSTLNAALQRLGSRTAYDVGLHSLFTNQWSITLGAAGTAGEDPIYNLTPSLLIDERARRWWRLTMTGVRFPLKYRPNPTDLDNPPPIPDPDYMYYTIFNRAVRVRDFQGNIPIQTALQFFGNKVPLISDSAIDAELFDDLVDIGVAVIMESESIQEVIRQAERTSEAPPISVQA